MSDSIRFQSDPDRDWPVTIRTHRRMRVVSALSRSYRSLMSGLPAQNQLCWRYNDKKAVFALCDGRESPFEGRYAARFLGERLADWLWALPDDSQTPQDELKVRLAYQLNAWAQLAQEQVLNAALPDGLTTDQREQLDAVRRSQGSETMFLCARMDFDPEQGSQVVFAWAGDIFLRCYTADGAQVQFDPVRSPGNRWSTVLGLRGSLSVARLEAGFDIRRVLAFSPEIGALEPDPAQYTPRRLQSLLQECFLNRAGGDLAWFDFHFVEQPVDPVEQPLEVTHFQEQAGPVRLRYLETSDHTGVFEWSFPPDAVYSLVEEQGTDGSAHLVYAGAGGHWIVPPDRLDRRYRVCAVSPDGKFWSSWTEPVLVDEPVWEDEPDNRAGVQLPGEEPPVQAELTLEVVESEVPPETFEAEAHNDSPWMAGETQDDLTTSLTEPLPPDDLGVIFWSEPTEPAPPEKEITTAQGLDWETWQPSYYVATDPAAPAAALDASKDSPPAGVIEAPPAELEPAESTLSDAPGEQISLEQPGEPDTRASQLTDDLPLVELVEPEVEMPAAAEPASHPGWLNFRASRGDQPGEYLLEWEPVTQVRDFEIKKTFAGRDHTHTVRGVHDLIKGLDPGRHYFRIRPIYPGPRQEWDEHNLAVIEVPDRIQQAPSNLQLEAGPEGAFTLSWVFSPPAYVEEFWVYDATPRSAVLLHRLPGDASRCVIQPAGLETRCKYTVRAVNWSGVGPESKAVVYNPPGLQPQQSGWNRVMQFFRSATPATGAGPAKPPAGDPSQAGEKAELQDTITCSTFYELCEQVTRYLKHRGIRMERIRLEQRVGTEDHYIPVDSRRTSELMSLNFTKGPDHRLFVFGSKGEVVTAMITFDKTRWTMKVRFSVSNKAG